MPRPLDLEQKIDFVNKSGLHLLMFDQFFSPVGDGCDAAYLDCCNAWVAAAKLLLPDIEAWKKPRLGMPPSGASVLVDRIAEVEDRIAELTPSTSQD